MGVRVCPFDFGEWGSSHVLRDADCLRYEFGYEGGEGSWAAHMDVVDGRSNGHYSQAQFDQAAGVRALWFNHLEQRDVRKKTPFR